MESSCAHPLQSLADAATIEENKKKSRPKIVLSWAPHPKSLPHAVANSFVNMCKKNNYNLVITNPKGYNLDPKITRDIEIFNDQEKAFKNVDFVYAKKVDDHSVELLYNGHADVETQNQLKETIISKMHGYHLEFHDSMHAVDHSSDSNHEEAHSHLEQDNHHGPTFKWLVHIGHAAHGDEPGPLA